MSNKCETCLHEQKMKIEGVACALSYLASRIEELFQRTKSIGKHIEMELDTINDSKGHDTMPF